MENKEDEKIYFPQNVSAQYEIIQGLGWKQIKRYVLPAILIIIGIVVLPPYNSVLFWIFKVFIFTVLAIGVVIMVIGTPIHARKNITMEMYIKQEIAYAKRQKVFFVEKKDKRINGK